MSERDPRVDPRPGDVVRLDCQPCGHVDRTLEVKTSAVLISEVGGAAPRETVQTALQETITSQEQEQEQEQEQAQEQGKVSTEKSRLEKPRLVSSERSRNLSSSVERKVSQKEIEEPSLSASTENSKLLIGAMHELLAWKRKYILLSGVTGLKGVFLAINELEGK